MFENNPHPPVQMKLRILLVPAFGHLPPKSREGKEDFEDLMILRAAKMEDLGQPSIPLEKVKEQLGIKDSSK